MINFYLKYPVIKFFLEKFSDQLIIFVKGFKCLLEAFEATPGSHDLCVDLLKQGHILAISPGGTREALFSDNYEIIWGNRLGFAKVAVEAKVVSNKNNFFLAKKNYILNKNNSL